MINVYNKKQIEDIVLGIGTNIKTIRDDIRGDNTAIRNITLPDDATYTPLFPSAEATPRWNNVLATTGSDYSGLLIPITPGETITGRNPSDTAQLLILPIPSQTNIESGNVIRATPIYVEPLDTFTYNVRDIDEVLWVAGHTDNNSFVAPVDVVIKEAPSKTSLRALNDDINILKSNVAGSIIPNSILMSEQEGVIYTAMNYIVKVETIDNIEYVMTSNDLGRTWMQFENTLGRIMFVHIFTDGTLLICSNAQAYWSADYETLHPSTMLNADGTEFTAGPGINFFSHGHENAPVYINGREFLHWGEYTLDVGESKAWYTRDKGRTIKISARTGSTPMDAEGEPHNFKHFTRMIWNESTGHYYALVGDSGPQPAILRASYDMYNDEWKWEVVASGAEYKLANIFFDTNHAYVLTSYTEFSLRPRQGLYRTSLADLSDSTRWSPVWTPISSEWDNATPMDLYMDAGSDVKIIFPDYNGVGKLWIAREGYDFKVVSFAPSSYLIPQIGRNYKGDFYALSINNGQNINNAVVDLRLGSFNLTQSIQGAGLSEFSRYNPTIQTNQAAPVQASVKPTRLYNEGDVHYKAGQLLPVSTDTNKAIFIGSSSMADMAPALANMLTEVKPGMQVLNISVSGHRNSQQAPRLAAAHEYKNAIQVMWSGKNNLTNSNASINDVETIMTETSEMIESSSALIKKLVVLTHFVNTGTPADSEIRARIDQCNALIKERYGPVVFDVNEHILGEQMFTDLGLTRAAEDISEQALGNLPPTLSRNYNHVNLSAASYLAEKLVEFMKANGTLGVYEEPEYAEEPDVMVAPRVLVDARNITQAHGEEIMVFEATGYGDINERTFTPPATGWQPPTVNTIGRASIEYHGNNVLTSNNRSITTETNTYLIIAKQDNPEAHTSRNRLVTGDLNAGFQALTLVDNIMAARGGAGDMATIGPATADWFILTVAFDGPNSKYALNGTTVHPIAITPSKQREISLGGNLYFANGIYGGEPAGVKGHIALFAYFEGVLTDEEISYIMTRYANELQIPIV